MSETIVARKRRLEEAARKRRLSGDTSYSPSMDYSGVRYSGSVDPGSYDSGSCGDAGGGGVSGGSCD